MDTLAFSSAGAPAKSVRDRQIGCLELIDLDIERIERLDAGPNAVVVRGVERPASRGTAFRSSQQGGPRRGRSGHKES